MDTARCPSCHAPIWWGLTSPGGKLMPIDAQSSEKGNVVVSQDELTMRALGSLLVGDPQQELPCPVRVLRKDEQGRDDLPRWTPHFATCRRPR